MSKKEKTVDIPASDRRLMGTNQVCAFLSISHDTLQALRADPDEKFPRPLQMTSGKHHWALADLEVYVSRKMKQRDAIAR